MPIKKEVELNIELVILQLENAKDEIESKNVESKHLNKLLELLRRKAND